MQRESSILYWECFRKVIHFDQVPLKQREVIQQIWLVHDTHRRIHARRSFLFSLEVSVNMELKYEQYFGFTWLVTYFCMAGGL